MKYTFPSILAFICMLSFFSCNEDVPNPALDLGKTIIIPQPLKVESTGSSFQINSGTTVQNLNNIKAVDGFVAQLKKTSGFNLESTKTSNENTISFSLDEASEMGAEGYTLDITDTQINLSAKTEHGIFNGIQTLRQLLPTEFEGEKPENINWYVPSGKISDKPEYAYRGSMLDVARHFFEVKDVKRVIDLIAQYKINTLHLHLTDDQGWRIEIKSWPNLTTHGGSTQVGGEAGGFYTQEQYKDIVAYAATKFITIVPEVDMPGHTNAALASYPELNCDGKATKLYTGTEVGFSTFCTSKEVVYKFIDDVIREISEMTPGPYFHLGGDESHVTEMKDYIPFIERTSAIVNKYGKQVMGWDEIAHAKLPANSTVHYWNKAENAKMGVEQNAKVLISPATKAYLDMQYDSTTRIGLHWAAYVEVDSAYMWEPSELVEGITKENILGVESPLWSETVVNMDDIEYLVFPRLIAHSEIGWTPSKFRNWENFKVRLGKHKDRLEIQNVDYYPSKLVPWAPLTKVEVDNP
ncbi:MAG: beta-N-acetylhexosaminidase [Saprospiraceae bacterium]|nr:beta-N-acetylhexosaminidase [Saprospiraceae bacterium]